MCRRTSRSSLSLFQSLLPCLITINNHERYSEWVFDAFLSRIAFKLQYYSCSKYRCWTVLLPYKYFRLLQWFEAINGLHFRRITTGQLASRYIKTIIYDVLAQLRLLVSNEHQFWPSTLFVMNNFQSSSNAKGRHKLLKVFPEGADARLPEVHCQEFQHGASSLDIDHEPCITEELFDSRTETTGKASRSCITGRQKWEDLKCIIQHRYLIRGLTLDETISYVKHNHNFIARQVFLRSAFEAFRLTLP